LAVDDITCRELLELLTEYLEGALAPTVEVAVATHLDACEGCRRYLEQLNISIEVTAALREDSVPADVRETLLAAFRSWRRPEL
jgi:predicted anti-sigma-YlaC factor YlaD